MSDILLLILDIRYATATFPPSLYDYIVAQGKTLILVLNKIDLIPPSLSAAWKDYFTSKFPQLKVVFFTSFPAYSMVAKTANKTGMQFRRLKANFGIAKEGALQIQQECQAVSLLDLSAWRDRIQGAAGQVQGTEVETEGGEAQFVTVGTIGHPNVGKSSLINSLLGRKLVSVSRTPGHTKHFQTLFLCPEVRLCDCPGLVFPSQVPRSLQILMGSFPISQVREPYSVVQYLAERLDLPHLLNLELESEVEAPGGGWSAMAICLLWAKQRGYTTARTGREDTYRAANHILRLALEGKLCLAFQPPGYMMEQFMEHPTADFVREVLGKKEEEEMEDGRDFSEEDEEESVSSEDDETVSTANPFAALGDDTG